VGICAYKSLRLSHLVQEKHQEIQSITKYESVEHQIVMQETSSEIITSCSEITHEEEEDVQGERA
jgi:hypothetical protein